MEPRDPAYKARVAALFEQAGFVRSLGVSFVDCGPGWCEAMLAVQPAHAQQDGFIHAGVQATLADHTAGGAAGTLMRADQIVLTVEYKVNLLRPARGDRLRCRADVVRAGRQLAVVEARVECRTPAGAWKLVSTLNTTMAYVALSAESPT